MFAMEAGSVRYLSLYLWKIAGSTLAELFYVSGVFASCCDGDGLALLADLIPSKLSAVSFDALSTF